jgi:hypothetical protein
MFNKKQIFFKAICLMIVTGRVDELNKAKEYFTADELKDHETLHDITEALTFTVENTQPDYVTHMIELVKKYLDVLDADQRARLFVAMIAFLSRKQLFVEALEQIKSYTSIYGMNVDVATVKIDILTKQDFVANQSEIDKTFLLIKDEVMVINRL